MKGRKNLRRMGIVLGLGALLCAGVMASGALGMALVDPGSTDSTSTAADTSPASTDTSDLRLARRRSTEATPSTDTTYVDRNDANIDRFDDECHYDHR